MKGIDYLLFVSSKLWQNTKMSSDFIKHMNQFFILRHFEVCISTVHPEVVVLLVQLYWQRNKLVFQVQDHGDIEHIPYRLRVPGQLISVC